MSDLMPAEAKAILEARQALITAGMDITLQFDRTPFCIGIQPLVLPEEIRLPAKEEIRLAVVDCLECQMAIGEADIAISQARAHTPQQGGQNA